MTLLWRRVVTCTKGGRAASPDSSRTACSCSPGARAAGMGLRTWTWAAAALLLAAAAAAQTAQQQASQEGLPGSGSGVSGVCPAPLAR